MPLVTSETDMWVLKPQKEDIAAGARYAAVSLPWTFNRMMLNTGVQGQNSRALNIAKGIVGQEILRRELAKREIQTEVHRKSHREEDFFDLYLKTNGRKRKLDLKSIHHYSNYDGVDREHLSAGLVTRHADYAGSDWRRFFPMMVAHTQIGQDKEAYCYAIGSSLDIRKDLFTDRNAAALAFFPYGEALEFLSSKRLCREREDVERGFHLYARWQPRGMYDEATLDFKVIGEWAGKVVEMPVTAKAGQDVPIGPFSCVASFSISRTSFEKWSEGTLSIGVQRNDFRTPVLNTTKRNINKTPSGPCVYQATDVCNLILPSNYTLYVMGWLLKDEFLQACRKYTGWVWPMDAISRYDNQAWSQITENDVSAIERAGFADAIQKRPSLLRAGWLKTHGRGGGACCYVYPNQGASGGVKEHNLYCLLQDLRTIASIG
jgi:hypothetical protein